MRVPHIFRIGALVLATTGFYGYVGQMVPQKEVQPPKETALGSDMTTADMVKVGREIMEGKGLCVTCHTPPPEAAAFLSQRGPFDGYAQAAPDFLRRPATTALPLNPARIVWTLTPW